MYCYCRNSFLFIVISIILIHGVSGYAQDEPLKRLSRGWEVKGLDLEWTSDRVAKDLASTSSPIILIREGWDEIVVIKADTDGRIRTFENEARPRISIKTNGKSHKQMLDEITAQHGSIVWRFDANQRVVYITEKHLVSDKRWRLNDPLGEYGAKELTFQQAKDLLIERFGLTLGRKQIFMRYKGDPNVIVWRPGEQQEKTVRALVVALIKFSTKMNNMSFNWFIRLFPSLDDPKTGYEGLKGRGELQWNVSPSNINDDATFKKYVDLLERMKAEKEAAKKK